MNRAKGKLGLWGAVFAAVLIMGVGTSALADAVATKPTSVGTVAAAVTTTGWYAGNAAATATITFTITAATNVTLATNPVTAAGLVAIAPAAIATKNGSGSISDGLKVTYTGITVPTTATAVALRSAILTVSGSWDSLYTPQPTTEGPCEAAEGTWNGTAETCAGAHAVKNATWDVPANTIGAVTVTGSPLAAGSKPTIQDATITLSQTSYTYNGTERRPTVTAKVGSTTLKQNTDYTVGYSNATNAGTATVTLTRVTTSEALAAGDPATKTFTINKATPTKATFATTPALPGILGSDDLVVTAASAVTFGGSVEPTLKFNGSEDPPEAGAKDEFYVVTVSITGASNYNNGTDIELGTLIVPAATGSKIPVVSDDVTANGATTAVSFVTGTGKVTWAGAPTTQPTYKGTFSLAAPKLVSGANIGSIDTAYLLSPGGKFSFKTGSSGTSNPGTTATTVTADEQGTHTIATVLVTKKETSTGSGASKVTTAEYFIAANEISVSVSRKNLDAKWITMIGKYSYTGQSLKDELKYEVKAGTNEILSRDEDFEDATVESAVTKSGKGTLVLKGIGNYAGSATLQFDINKADLTLDVWSSSFLGKNYNGSANVDSNNIELVFDGLQGGDELVWGKDYTVTNAKFASADVTDYGDITGSVSLIAAGPVAQNYTLTPTASPFTIFGAAITKVEAADSHFVYTVPTNHYYTGSRRGIGNVTWKSGITNGSAGTFRVMYTYSTEYPLVLGKNADGTDNEFTGDTTIAPTNAGTYPVYIALRPGTNFDTASVVLKTVDNEDYVIAEPATAEWEDGWETSVDTRKGVSTTLKVVATSPNGGTLSYRWFRGNEDESSVISGQSGSTYTFTPSAEGELEFFVEITNRVAGVQANATVRTTVVTVRVGEAPVAVDAYIEFAEGALAGKIYHGGAQEFTEEELLVMIPGEDGEDPSALDPQYYKVTYGNNVDAGNTAVVRAVGIPLNGYTFSATKTFAIQKKVTDGFDFAYIAERTYGDTGVANGASVKPQPGTTGMGEVTVKYDGETEVPTVAGTYSVEVSVSGSGKNYTAATDVFICTYELKKRELVAKDLDYKIGSMVAYDGEPKSIERAVSIKASVGGESFTGTLTTLYGGFEELPTDIGVYPITVVIVGDENFETTVIDELGSFEIRDAKDAVAGSDRVVPVVPGSDVGAVAPVKGVAGTFSVGPSPAKAGDKVKFFWSGKAVTGGTILVYASTGELAKRISVSKVVGSELATWKSVSAGTYLAKGVLVGKDGTKEKVSFLFVVR